MCHAPSEMRAIASEILLALGDHESAYNVSTQEEWWDHLPKKVEPDNFSNAADYYKNAVGSGLWKKYQDFPGSAEARSAATLEKWHAAEKQCYRTNSRFDSYFDYEVFASLEPEVQKFLLDLQAEVRRVMGRVPTSLKPKFGPGATYATKGGVECAVPSKISTVPTMTGSMKTFLFDWRQTLWGRNRSSVRPFDYPACTSFDFEAFYEWPTFDDPTIVRGNRFEEVPKNKEVNRAIAIEPSLNIFYQLAYGTHLKKRLRSFGQLLVESVDWLGRRSGVSSEETHRLLAKTASITGDLATIDLSAASDTVAFSFVEWCVSPEWFSVLSALRCNFTEIEGKAYYLEKFSSMGNGFTFELETVLFFCICRVVLRSTGHSPRCSVFGDDIIVPSSSYRNVCAALRFCGFTPNPSKSFHTGLFRESCGGDYFGGTYVRSPTISGEPRSPLDWVVIHNQIARIGGDVDMFHIEQAKNICLRNIPKALRLYGPEVLGDVVLHGPVTKWVVRDQRYCGLGHLSRGKKTRTVTKHPHIKCISIQPESYKFGRWDAISAACSRVYGLTGDTVSVRGDPAGFSTQWVPLTAGYQALLN